MGGGTYIDAAMRARLDAITWTFKKQWRWAARSRPHLEVTLGVIANHADSDNMLTTLLDCLRTAGVIVNDNTNHLRSYRVEVFDHDGPKPCVSITVHGGSEV